MSFLSPNSLSLPTAGRSEYGRVKVALPKGKGLMDWVRLTSGKILAKKTLPAVDEEELAKHCVREDCWVHLFGNVYDVTAYLDFHPGGVDELMRASGRDATALFNQYHPWVNYDNFLKSCYVGKFCGDLSKLKSPDPPTALQQSTSTQGLATVTNFPPKALNVSISHPLENVLCIKSSNWKKLTPVNVSISSESTSFRILVRHFNLPVTELLWEHLNDYRLKGCRFTVTCSSDSFEVRFEENLSREFREDNCAARKRPMTQYHKCKIEDTRFINHDTLLIRAKKLNNIYMPIPLGHHVSMRIRKGGSTIYRPYTPVDGETVSRDNGKAQVDEGQITFMIKIYPTGIASPTIGTYKIDDEFEISDSIGDKDFFRFAKDTKKCLFLAAGTGLTPMIGLLAARLRGRKLQVSATRLLMFNKRQEDIVSDDWMPFKWDDTRLEIMQVLSEEPSSEWQGLRGRINAEMFPVGVQDYFVFVCGPDGFVLSATKLLMEAGCRSENVQVFQG